MSYEYCCPRVRYRICRSGATDAGEAVREKPYEEAGMLLHGRTGARPYLDMRFSRVWICGWSHELCAFTIG